MTNSEVLQSMFLELWGWRHKDGVWAVGLVSIRVRHQIRSERVNPFNRKMTPALMIQVPPGVLDRNALKKAKEGSHPQTQRRTKLPCASHNQQWTTINALLASVEQ